MYLAAIYLLDEEGGDPVQAQLARRLGHSAAAVSEMVTRLGEAGLITADRRHLTLTPAGVGRAEASIRRHRLAERLLTDVIGLDWTTAHQEASRWEQVISPTVERLLITLLGSPTTSSLGTPIPGAGAEQADARPILKTAPGERVRVTKLTETLQEDRETIRYLADHGVAPGSRLTVHTQAPDGTFTVTSDQADNLPLSISPTLALHIYVAPSGVEHPPFIS